MLILGLGRSAVLCNMLKLMRCNKWANPPKACPLWQKHKAFRQAWRCLCLSRRQARSSQWVSISLWEKRWIWLIVRDMCPGSSPRVQEVSMVGAERRVYRAWAIADHVHNPWGFTGKHLVRIRSVVQHTDRNKQSGSNYNTCTVIICCRI